MYSDRIPDPEIIRENIEISRHAPNHHRTEPARFYLLDSDRIQKIGKLFGEILAGDLSDPSLVERGKKKSKEWGNAPGLLIVTCLTEINSELVRKNPEVADEDYATCCCICQIYFFYSPTVALLQNGVLVPFGNILTSQKQST